MVHQKNAFLSGFMGNELECGINKLCEPQSSSQAIYLFPAPIHSPGAQKNFLYLQYAIQHKPFFNFLRKIVYSKFLQ